MQKYVSIGRLAGLALVGLVFATVIERPSWTLPLIVLDEPLTLHLSGPWLIAALLIVVTRIGTYRLLELRPVAPEGDVDYTPPAWILPSVIVATGSVVIARFEPLTASWLFVLGGTLVCLIAALLGEFHVSDPQDPHFYTARIGLTGLVYATALVVFTTAYSAHVHTFLAGIVNLLVSFVLTASLLRWSLGPGSIGCLYAIATAYAVGFTTWAVNLRPFSGLVGGGLILLVFYLATGMVEQLTQRTLGLRVVIEFIVAAVVGLLLLIGFGVR